MAQNIKKTLPTTTNTDSRTRKHPDGTVLINVPLPTDLHRKLRVRCLTEDLVLSEAITRAVEAWLRTTK
jgi:hypothetical protein